MILPTTWRALQARDAKVWRVTIGAYTVQVGAIRAPDVPPQRIEHPERSELFATIEGATKHAAMFDHFAGVGVPASIIRQVYARDYRSDGTPLQSAAVTVTANLPDGTPLASWQRDAQGRLIGREPEGDA